VGKNKTTKELSTSFGINRWAIRVLGKVPKA
jgi:hypothetical protein